MCVVICGFNISKPQVPHPLSFGLVFVPHFYHKQNMPTDDWGDREVEILLSSAFVLSTLFGGSEAHLNVVRH